MILRVSTFLILNFAGLAIGSLFTSNGVGSEWYSNLNKAPWTPPGWVFGAAWTTIMICFSFYMADLWQSSFNKTLLTRLFILSWILNVLWNPVFFKFHQPYPGLLVIVCLTFLIGYFLIHYFPQTKFKSLLVLPYFIWLLIATSLNAYICLMN